MNYQDKLQKFADLIKRDQAQRFAKDYPNLDQPEVIIIRGNKYAKVDVGGSGAYMVDSEGKIFGVKAYGVIHKRYRYGTLDTIDRLYWGGYVGVLKPLHIKCIGFGNYEGKCQNPPGSSHSKLWCQRCDDIRRGHITKQLLAALTKAKGGL